MTIKNSKRWLYAKLRARESVIFAPFIALNRAAKVGVVMLMVGSLSACDQSPDMQGVAGDENKVEAGSETTVDTEVCSVDVASSSKAQVQATFDSQCLDCHSGDKAITNPRNLDLEGMTTYISNTMPFGNVSACVGNCAENMARLALGLNMAENDNCESDTDNADDSGSDDQPASDSEDDTSPDTETGKDTSENICDETVAAGKEQFDQHCSTCHYSNSQVANETGRSLSELTDYISKNMPSGTPTYCEGDCAAQTAAYIEYFLDPEKQQACEIEKDTQSEMVGNMFTRRTISEALYRTTINLVGRIPTAEERALVENNGNQGLASIVDELMEEEAFLNRVGEFYNELLHTDFYAQKSHKPWLLQWFTWNFSEAIWFEMGGEISTKDISNKLSEYTAYGIGREPVELVKYIVKNNRPISEVLTADYFMVNAYSARSYYSLYQTHKSSFNTLPDSVVAGAVFMEDPEHFIPVQLPETRAEDFSPGSFQGGVNGKIKHAGVLTSGMFLQKFPTTETNLNRHRSASVFKLFLDLDIEALPGLRPGDAEDSGPNPTMTNDACKGCHELMDPVASAFAVFRANTRYYPDEEWFPATDFRPVGFRGTAMPLTNGKVDYENALPWLAQQIVQDPGFVTATVRTVYSGLFGMEKVYKRSGDSLTPEQEALFSVQEAYFNHWEKTLLNGNMSLKALIKEMVLSDWFQGKDVAQETAAAPLLKVRSLLTPEMLDRKVSSLLDLNSDSHQTQLAKYDRLNIGYGGIDDQDSNLRILEQNGLMGTVQDYLPNAYACSIIVRDYERAIPNEDRKYVYKDTNNLPVEDRIFMVRDPHSRIEADIRANIQNMIYVLHGREIPVDHQEIDELYDLFNKVVDVNSEYTSIKNIRCVAPYKIGGGAFSDSDYSVGGYMAVLTVIMKNFNFFYE